MKNLQSIRLNDLLTILDISQKDFAAALGLSGTTIGNLISDKHKNGLNNWTWELQYFDVDGNLLECIPKK